MADVKTLFSTLSNDAPNVWIAKEVYHVAERMLILNKLGKQYTLPERFGKTLRIVRHKRIALPTATLSEGVPPDAVALAVEKVDVTVEQWGIVVLLTDVAMVTTEHPALQVAIERTGMAMAEMIERETATMLLGGSNVIFGGAATSRAGLTNADKMTTTIAIRAAASLRARGAMPYEGQLYHGCFAPQVEADLLAADATFQAASNFANVRALQEGEIGVWMGVRWYRGNFLPLFLGVAAPGTQTARVAGYSEAGAGGTLTGTKITVVARDANSDFERIISQEKTVGAGADSATITTPTSTNFTYDVYATDTTGARATYRLLFSRVAANTAVVVTPAAYAAGVAAIPPEAPATGVTVYEAYVFGKEAFGRVELNGMSLQSYLTPAGASFSNPLAQGRKVGSKIMWKTFLIDDAYYNRIEVGSAFPNELPA